MEKLNNVIFNAHDVKAAVATDTGVLLYISGIYDPLLVICDEEQTPVSIINTLAELI